MYKRIIGFILALCLLVPANAFVFAAETESDFSRAFDLVEGLGINVPDDEDAKMTRGQYAQLVSDVINFGMEIEPRNGEFKDVTKNNSFSGAVYDLVTRGVISGHEDGLFKPDDAIYMEQAVKILLSLMNYDAIAMTSGGYPMGYMKIADRYDMLEKIHKISGEALTVGEAVQLVANAINTPVLVPNSFGSTDGYETREDVTLLTEYMKLEKQTGIITDNGITALTGKSNVDENWIKINGEKYDATGSNACDYLGYKVDAYVTIDDINVEKVIYVQVDKKVEVQYIEAERLMVNDGAFSVTNIVYEDVYDRRKTVKVDIGADFIYNGTAHVNLRVDDLKITSGEIVLIDNDGDRIFEVVYVKPKQTIVVAGVNVYSYTLYDKYGNAPIVLDEDIKVRVKRDGASATVNDIAPWDVVSAYVSYDSSYVELIASSKTIKGTVEGYDSENFTIQIDGDYYHCVRAGIFSEINIGGEYAFCVDVQNNIAAVKTEEIQNSVAYFREVRYDTNEEKLLFRIYTPSGEHLQFYGSSRFAADGVSFENYQAAVDYLNSNVVGKLAEYRVDKEGEIRRVFTPYVGAVLPKERNGDLHQYFDSASTTLSYCVSQQSFGAKVVIGNKTKVFHIPTNTASLNDYSIKDYNYFRNTWTYTFKAYSIGDEDGVADYLVMAADASAQLSSTNAPMVVSKVKTVFYDGEVREHIVAYGSLGEKEYLGATDSIFSDASVEKGDIVRCITDIQGEVIEVVKVYDASSNTIVRDSDKDTTFDAGYNATERTTVGSVFLRYDALLGITTANLSSTSMTEAEKVAAARDALEYHNVKNAKIYAVDKNEGYAVEEITVDRIYDYQQFYSEYSKVYMYATHGAPNILIVYN